MSDKERGDRVGIRTAMKVKSLEGHEKRVACVAMSPDGRLGLSGSESGFRVGVLRLWDLTTGECIHVLEGHESNVVSVAISQDGKLGLSGCQDDTVRLWELATGRCVQTFEVDTLVSSVAMNPDGRFGLAGIHETVHLWNLTTGERMRTFGSRGHELCSVALSPRGRFVLTGGETPFRQTIGTTLNLWDIETGKCLRTLQGYTVRGLGVKSVVFSQDGRFGLTGGQHVALWELGSGECLRTYESERPVNCIAISPDGKFGFWSSSDIWSIWDLRTGVSLHELKGHTSFVESIAISADGRYVLTASRDCTLGLWELDWEWAPKGETRTLAEEFGIDTTKSLEEIYEKKLRKGKGLIGKLFGSRP